MISNNSSILYDIGADKAVLVTGSQSLNTLGLKSLKVVPSLTQTAPRNLSKRRRLSRRSQAK